MYETSVKVSAVSSSVDASAAFIEARVKIIARIDLFGGGASGEGKDEPVCVVKRELGSGGIGHCQSHSGDRVCARYKPPSDVRAGAQGAY